MGSGGCVLLTGCVFCSNGAVFEAPRQDVAAYVCVCVYNMCNCVIVSLCVHVCVTIAPSKEQGVTSKAFKLVGGTKCTQ